MAEINVSEHDLLAAHKMMEVFTRIFDWGMNGGGIDIRRMYLDLRREYPWFRRTGLQWTSGLPQGEAQARRVWWRLINKLGDNDIEFFEWHKMLKAATQVFPALDVYLLMVRDPSQTRETASIAVSLGYKTFA